MAPKYKVSYFGITALAEPIRMMLSYMGEEFEDFRFGFNSEEWKNMKPTTPFGKCPVLSIEGKDVCQSKAICRYLGRKAGLSGKDEWEDMQIDMMVDTIDDMRLDLGKYYWCPDENFKALIKERTVNGSVPYYLKKIDAIVKSNNGYLANGKLSWGDIYFTSMYNYLSSMYGSDIAADCPNIKALFASVEALPKVKEWIAKRPHSDL